MPSTEPTRTIEECSSADQAAQCYSADHGEAHKVPEESAEQPMMYGDRAEMIAVIVLIALLAIIGAIVCEAWLQNKEE